MAVFRYLVRGTNCDLVLRERIFALQSTKSITTSQYLVTEVKDLDYHKGLKYSNKNTVYSLGLYNMKAPEDPDPRCEKYLPFRKRSRHRYCPEGSNPNPTKEPSNLKQRNTEENSSSSSKANEAQDTSTVPLSSEECCSSSNIQEDLRNLRLMPEDGVVKDQEEPTIPLTVESLPSSSTSNTKRTPFLCTFCRKKFHHKGDLNKHLRSHTKEQPYKCTYCSSKFSHTSNLQRHLRIHTGCKPHSCEFCNRTFSRIDKLHLHQRNGPCKTNKQS